MFFSHRCERIQKAVLSAAVGFLRDPKIKYIHSSKKIDDHSQERPRMQIKIRRRSHAKTSTLKRPDGETRPRNKKGSIAGSSAGEHRKVQPTLKQHDHVNSAISKIKNVCKKGFTLP